jgi:hypothetical protein
MGHNCVFLADCARRRRCCLIFNQGGDFICSSNFQWFNNYHEPWRVTSRKNNETLAAADSLVSSSDKTAARLFAVISAHPEPCSV